MRKGRDRKTVRDMKIIQKNARVSGAMIANDLLL